MHHAAVKHPLVHTGSAHREKRRTRIDRWAAYYPYIRMATFGIEPIGHAGSACGGQATERVCEWFFKWDDGLGRGRAADRVLLFAPDVNVVPALHKLYDEGAATWVLWQRESTSSRSAPKRRLYDSVAAINSGMSTLARPLMKMSPVSTSMATSIPPLDWPLKMLLPVD